MELSKLPGHLSMVGGSNPHPLMHGAPLCRIDYGQAQLGPPNLLRGKLLGQGCALPIGLFLLLVGVYHPVRQAQDFHLGHVPSLACVRKLVLEIGGLTNCLIGLLMNRSQEDSTLLGPLSSWVARPSASMIDAVTLSHAVAASSAEAATAQTAMAQTAPITTMTAEAWVTSSRSSASLVVPQAKHYVKAKGMGC
jgi:hypothetical protein